MRALIARPMRSSSGRFEERDADGVSQIKHCALFVDTAAGRSRSAPTQFAVDNNSQDVKVPARSAHSQRWTKTRAEELLRVFAKASVNRCNEKRPGHAGAEVLMPNHHKRTNAMGAERHHDSKIG